MISARGVILLMAAVALACRPDRGGGATAADISITHAVVPAPPSPSEASVFLAIDNLGLAADTLTAARSPEADSVLLHEMVGGRMQVAAALAIPPGGPVRLAPGSYHLMLHGLTRRLAAGDTVTLELHFARAGSATVRAPVLRYTEAVEEDLLAPPLAGAHHVRRDAPPALSLRRARGLRHHHRRRPPRRGRHRQPAAGIGPARDQRLPDHVLPGNARPEDRHRRAADDPRIAGHRSVRGGNAGGASRASSRSCRRTRRR